MDGICTEWKRSFYRSELKCIVSSSVNCLYLFLIVPAAGLLLTNLSLNFLLRVFFSFSFLLYLFKMTENVIAGHFAFCCTSLLAEVFSWDLTEAKEATDCWKDGNTMKNKTTKHSYTSLDKFVIK